MHYYKIILQYAGTNYAGFQWQNGPKTIQAELNRCLQILIDGKVTTMSASRTDTGVHALMQIVKVTCEHPILGATFLKDINKLLPLDINILSIEKTSGEFRPSVGHHSKEYRYFFTNEKIKTHQNQFIANIANPLNFPLMEECLLKLMGEHDFINFYSSGSNVKSSKRIVYSCELTSINPHDFFQHSDFFKIDQEIQQVYQLRIVANGFLKQMIRHVVSGLWMVGSGKISKEDFFDILDGPKKEEQLWKVAPAKGLFLVQFNSKTNL